MKNTFRLVVMTLLTAGLLSQLGCGKENIHILDGPDMGYSPPWLAFTISRSDSNAQYNFWFTVTETGSDVLVTGACMDGEGKLYEEKTGIPIAGETVWALRWMDLEQLSDEEEWPEDMERPLDDSNITLTVILSDKTVVKKKASGKLSMEIYQLLLPYFINNQS